LERDYAPLPPYLTGEVYQPGKIPSFGLYSAALYELGRFLDAREDGTPYGDRCRWPIHSDCHAEYARARPLVWALVRELARASSAAGSSFVVTLSPTLIDSPNDAPPWRVRSFLVEYQADAAAIGVPAINCVEEYFAEGGHDRFRNVHDVFHLNAQGNALVARHTARWLKVNIPARHRNPNDTDRLMKLTSQRTKG
jgi:hypothetical protein